MRVVAALAVVLLAACAQEPAAQPSGAEAAEAYEPGPVREALAAAPVPIEAVAPEMNARRGRILFITKSCVICHAANGVGGTAAPAIPAPAADHRVNPLEFSARMWKGAPAMVRLQQAELGYQIDLDAQDLADLAAFAGSAEEQALLTPDSLPAGLEDWFLNEPIFNDEEWADYKSRGERLPETSDFDKP